MKSISHFGNPVRPRLSVRAGLLALVLCGASTLQAQVTGSGTATTGSRPAKPLGSGTDTPVPLTVKPATGDVLYLQMRQTIEMGAQRREGYALPKAGVEVIPDRDERRGPPLGPRRSAVPTRTTAMDFYAHSTVEVSDASGSIVSTVVDSLLVRTTDLGQPPRSERLPVPVGAPSTRIRVRSNGSMIMENAPASSAAVGATLSAMPAMLPDSPVKVGDTWERDVDMPPLPMTTYRADGVLRAVFRLDSITDNGRDAYVSLRGSLRREGTTRDLPPGTRVVTDGMMTGTLMLDRARGWITDVNTVIDVISEVVAPADGGPPLQLGIRITQRLRVR